MIDYDQSAPVSDDEAVASLSSNHSSGSNGSNGTTLSQSSSGTGFTNSVAGSSVPEDVDEEEEDYCVPIHRQASSALVAGRPPPPVTEPKPAWLRPSLDRAAGECWPFGHQGTTIRISETGPVVVVLN